MRSLLWVDLNKAILFRDFYFNLFYFCVFFLFIYLVDGDLVSLIPRNVLIIPFDFINHPKICQIWLIKKKQTR